MKTQTIAMLAMLIAGSTLQAADSPAPAQLSRQPQVIAAMTRAWIVASGSQFSEAGFRVDRSGDEFSVVAAPFSNETMAATLTVNTHTVALFHVHPVAGDPRPSRQDQSIARAHGVQIYTMSSTGLYMFDPVSGETTLLARNHEWMKR